MSVVVMDVDIPEDCDSCWLPGKHCNLWLATDVGERHRGCPIRPLPEKHGDLVDISQEVNIEYFDDMNQEWSWKAGTVADALVVCEEFPMTIVEAEGE